MDASPLRFRVVAGHHLPTLGPLEASVLAHIEAHPGATATDAHACLSPVGDPEYGQVRSAVVGLVDMGLLKVDGQVPLEQVDQRYERIEACDLCGSPSDDHRIVFWKHNTPVVRCSECGLLYANPRWKAEHLFGRYGDAAYWAEYAGKIEQTAVDPVANLARWSPYVIHLESLGPRGRLLDVGCASGEFLVAAQSRGWEVYGVEPAPLAAQQARQATGAHIEIGTLEDASYPDGWFDAITLWDVLEHLQSPRAYISHIARLLRPGGLLSLTTPNIRSGAYKLLGLDWHVVGPNEHIYYFTPRTLTRLLTGNGLAVHSMDTFATPVDVWRQWLRPRALQPLAPLLHKATTPIARRLLLGDGLYVVARRSRLKIEN
jgi:2-polyprenyl-3-methyl-5-hydroxy-6-metoxy-1,4-benzoquinol methylase